MKMANVSPFASSPEYRPIETREYAGQLAPVRFTEVAEEYRQGRATAVVLDRSDRVIVEASGKDRATWLHNLLTNAIKDLDESHGNYAFACDVRGRIQFDLNVLVRDGAIWLDLDAMAVERALQHFKRYLITEDVKLTPQPARFARLAVAGPRVWEVAERMGLPHGGALPALGHFTLAGGGLVMVRHDLTGDAGFELLFPPADAPAWWSRAVAAGAAPVGSDAFEALRVEAGIPRFGKEVDDTVVPAETGQIERAIGYHKGCYLGQEVVERMRAYNALARRLVKLSMGDGAGLALPSMLKSGEREAGRITSLLKHPVKSGWIGLGYLRTQFPATAELTTGDPARAVAVVAP